MQKELAEYEKKINSGLQDKDLAKYEKQIEKSQADIKAAQANIDKLLRRNK